MDRQLALLEEGTPSWRLDDRSRQLGREGIAQARAALARAAQAKATHQAAA